MESIQQQSQLGPPSTRRYPRPTTLSYLSVPGQTPLIGSTIGQLIDSAAVRFPRAEGLVFCDRGTRWSFQQLREEIESLAGGLLAPGVEGGSGLERGDRVGIWGPNSHLFYVTQMAVWKAGLVAVCMNSAFQPKELLPCLTGVGMRALVIDEAFKTQNYYELICSVVPELAGSRPGNLRSPAAPELRTVATMEPCPRGGTLTIVGLMEAGRSVRAKQVLASTESLIQFDDVCSILFTSGTTTVPKGASLTHHSLLNNSLLVGRRFGFTEQDRICLTVPLFHIFGSVIGTLLALHFGSTCVLPAKAFSGSASVAAAAKEHCTVIYGTPTMHMAMLNVLNGLETHDLRSLRLVCTGAAPCPELLIKEMKTKYGVETVVTTYGMTETSPIVFQSLSEDTDTTRSLTVGYPLEHTEVKIVDNTGRIVPLGVPGELCVRGYLTMAGYWNDRERTDQIIDSARWLHTGDLMVMHATGHGSIVGRLKDVIIRGGENIHPKEVEELLNSHPDILEVQVFGLHDPSMGEEVAAWMRVRPCVRVGGAVGAHTLTEEEVRAFCRGKIAYFKIPRFIRFVDEFPTTVSGKIQKHLMQKEELRLRAKLQPF